VPELGEGEALQLICRLFGYDDFDLPLSVEGTEKGSLPVEEIFAPEVARLKVMTSGNVALYPPVSAQGDLEQVRQLCAAVVENGCDGAMLRLNVDKEEDLRIIREAFG